MTARPETNRIVVHPVLGDNPRNTTVWVHFNGERLQALAGESVAAALLAQGDVVNWTLPDAGSPRGYFCGVGRCPDCMLTVDGELNVRACLTPIRVGMVIETQHGLGTWKVRD